MKDNNTTEKEGIEKLSRELPRTEIPDIFAILGFFHPDKLYFYYFQDLPNKLKFYKISPDIFLKKFKKQFGDYIIKDICEKSYSIKGKEKLVAHLLILREKVLIQIETEAISLFYTGQAGNFENSIKKIILESYPKIKQKSEIGVIVSHGGGYLNTKKIKFKKPIINFQENYCDDFPPVHEEVLRQLQMRQESGLFLFYGKPGTGKSTYLRYLIKSVRKKTIFISPKMAGNLDSVEVTKLLLDNKNTILVIEDAEELVVSRKHERNSNLSMILNLTDGILGESLGIQVIATFNTELKNIDSALIRKGRLKTSYEFKDLPKEKTSHLLLKQGIKVNNSGPMTLADIFNYSTNNNNSHESHNGMGFNRA